MNEQDKNNLFHAFLKQQGYEGKPTGSSPLYTLVSVMTGNINELFESTNLAQLFLNWQMHCAFVIKSIAQG